MKTALDKQSGRVDRAFGRELTQRFAVFEHAEAGRVTGRGFVVRKCDETGRAEDQFNYAGQTPVRGRTWKSQAVAEGVAHRLNNPTFHCGNCNKEFPSRREMLEHQSNRCCLPGHVPCEHCR